jgi:hypothetical protein
MVILCLLAWEHCPVEGKKRERILSDSFDGAVSGLLARGS